MKLSEMTTDHVFDTLAVTAIELEPILGDEKVIKALSKVEVDKNADMTQLGLNKINQMLSIVLVLSKTYRQGIYRILAEFSKTTPEEIGKKSLTENLNQIKDSLNDEEFLRFFPQLRSLVQTKSSDTLQKSGRAKQK